MRAAITALFGLLYFHVHIRVYYSMFRVLTKADVILFITFLAIGIGTILYGAHVVAGTISSDTSSRMVQITADNTVFGAYSLDENRTITVERNGHTNVVTIENGAVYISESTCKNQICVNDGSIDTIGQQIVCLPNRVVVEIIGDDSEREFDAISQ